MDDRTLEQQWNDLFPHSKPGPVPRIPHADDERITAEYLSGTTMTDIAARYSVSRCAVYRRLKSLGVLKRRAELRASTRTAIREAYADGRYSLRAIGRQFHVSNTTIYRIVADMPARPRAAYCKGRRDVPMPCPLVTADYAAIRNLPVVTDAQMAISRRTFLEQRDMARWDERLATDLGTRAEYERCVTEYRMNAMQHATEVAA